MAKRKRTANASKEEAPGSPKKVLKPTETAPKKIQSQQSSSNGTNSTNSSVTIQIVTGSYERVLHGITATITQPAQDEAASSDSVEFADTFLFHAHASAIRCLALSPAPNADSQQSQSVVLASGGTDDRINLYSLSTSPIQTDDKLPSIPTLAGNKIIENPKNRELGSLMHHSACVTALHFPSRSKLLSAGEDNNISITRTKDWAVVSSIKAPNPKVQGRPSGDTAPPGTAPAGVNDFAVHPSMKLMLSVGKSEKCMRLWNLVTGKRAGVLNFGREVLVAANERKWSSGEGQKITWDSQGEEFAVAFERGVMVFGIDCVPKCRAIPSPVTKVHHIKYLQLDPSDDASDQFLVVSTEDGRILFYSTDSDLLTDNDPGCTIPSAPLLSQLGGKSHGQSTRIKDFEILHLKGNSEASTCLAVTCSSDGAIKIWSLKLNELTQAQNNRRPSDKKKKSPESSPVQIGTLLGSYETRNRITCLKAFVMQKPTAFDDGDFEELSESELDDQSGVESSESENEG